MEHRSAAVFLRRSMMALADGSSGHRQPGNPTGLLCYNESVLDKQDRRARAKARWVERTLTEFYGPRPYNPDAYEKDLMGALVATLLSQHTSDLNSGRAYASLKSAFPGGWEEVRAASVESIADSIRSGGLAEMKAPRIKGLIQDVFERTGSTNLDRLHAMRTDVERIDFLRSFHGIGPKTAACLLCFNMGRPVIPVDTHVHRVSLRLGLLAAKTTADRAHDDLLQLVSERDAYSFHVHLIEHGRKICHARRPDCDCCPLRTKCDFALSTAASQ